ncbi:hypothetical protein [Exiguobacterium profundum]
MKTALKWSIATALVLPTVLPLQAPNVLAEVDEDIVKLRFLETTDLHTNITNYDYFDRQHNRVDESRDTHQGTSWSRWGNEHILVR